mmetsp:Transcript_11486/g.32139  ORF Transcript_11486/g.32139 Transcript_11486/m.32139 type:complete len:265 (+) Transcript_11486:215-1009(+)
MAPALEQAELRVDPGLSLELLESLHRLDEHDCVLGAHLDKRRRHVRVDVVNGRDLAVVSQFLDPSVPVPSGSRIIDRVEKNKGVGHGADGGIVRPSVGPVDGGRCRRDVPPGRSTSGDNLVWVDSQLFCVLAQVAHRRLAVLDRIPGDFGSGVVVPDTVLGRDPDKALGGKVVRHTEKRVRNASAPSPSVEEEDCWCGPRARRFRLEHVEMEVVAIGRFVLNLLRRDALGWLGRSDGGQDEHREGEQPEHEPPLPGHHFSCWRR